MLRLGLRLAISTVRSTFGAVVEQLSFGGDDVLLTQSGDAIITQNGDFLVKQDEFLITQSGIFLATQSEDIIELS